jgi:hypothetical protein
MKRRSFFQILTTVAAACFLPPIRAAQAVRDRVRHLPRWLDGRKRWEHLPVPVPDPSFQRFISPNDANKIVCRVLGPTHFRPGLSDAEYVAALEDAGWTPKTIERHMNHGHGLTLRCEACPRSYWVLGIEATVYGLWQVRHDGKGWVARCPDHRLPEALFPVS